MRATEALPLLHAALADVRNGEDLAARAAASQALSRLISAAAAFGDDNDEAVSAATSSVEAALEADPPVLAGGSGAEGKVLATGGSQDSLAAAGGDIRGVAERVLYSQLKRTLAMPSLAVRQVSLPYLTFYLLPSLLCFSIPLEILLSFGFHVAHSLYRVFTLCGGSM